MFVKHGVILLALEDPSLQTNFVNFLNDASADCCELGWLNFLISHALEGKQILIVCCYACIWYYMRVQNPK